MKYHFLLSIVTFALFSCSNVKHVYSISDSKQVSIQDKIDQIDLDLSINDTAFVNLKDFSKDFIFDMRYATNNNFLKQKVYDCPECFLRLKTVKALLKANQEFMKLGFRIKLYDCYRPRDVQKKMWSIVSDPNYVANPAKGSIHNRGGAVDITLVDVAGAELDMGTDFDFFGKEAGHNYVYFPEKILKNRVLLKTIMIQNNFQIFDSEWWHYNLAEAKRDKLSNFKWKCE